MSALTRVPAELWGLFVEDVSFTAAIVACLAFAWLLLPALTIPSPWRGALLFVLLAGALIENVSRSARR
jgi:fatty acid desaturase